VKRISVLSGKGGVGKTTVTIALAQSLAKRYKVGLFDADLSASNLHLLLDIKEDYDVMRDRIEPALATIEGKEMEFMSLSLVSESYCDWSGEKHGEFVSQVLEGTDFCSDYVIEDLPPGWHEDTAKAVELTDVSILVVLPGKLGRLDLDRTIELLREKRTPIAGAFINFSKHVCPNCGKESKLFGDEPNLEIPIIQRIPYLQNLLPEIDLDRLLTHLENPVTLEPRKGSPLKRKLTEMFLRKIG